ncbi:hypothetical protein HJG60_008079 [Phyllostomus discolor]|uniref:Uncharacterized protein n=1 Tax=Phyllostomus discolor TaxID=89673 RepID=A0A834EVZ2_9CHIR|nr:hypothetical protein HJG60_008079 [Phyllostomus discolor]
MVAEGMPTGEGGGGGGGGGRPCCTRWKKRAEVPNSGEKSPPDKALASRDVELFKEQTMPHSNILKQKQVSLDRFLVELPKLASSTVFREAKRQKTEDTPKKSPKLSKRTPLPSHPSPLLHLATIPICQELFSVQVERSFIFR